MQSEKNYIAVMVLYVFLLFITTLAAISLALVTKDDLRRFADANNNLAGRLYPRIIDGNSDNVCFCPLRLMTGLGIMLYGAREETEKQLYLVLGYNASGLPLEKVPETYNYYFSKMLPENIPDLVNYTLYCADEVLVATYELLLPDFERDTQKFYDATVKNVNFFDRGVTDHINNFVNQQTHGKISHIVDSVDPLSSSLLIDAVFFKGNWETPFPPYLTLPGAFNSPTGTKNVPFMQNIHSFPYFANKYLQAVLLPYIGGNLGLLVIVPRKENGLSDLEKTMTPDKIINVLHQLRPQETLVLLPKFSFQFFRNFSGDFEALGAPSAFYRDDNDFSGASYNFLFLVVSGILHKAAVKVDDADQGPGMCVAFRPQIPTLIANQSFMFLIVDRRLNLLLFWGRVCNF